MDIYVPFWVPRIVHICTIHDLYHHPWMYMLMPTIDYLTCYYYYCCYEMHTDQVVVAAAAMMVGYCLTTYEVYQRLC